MPRTKPYYPKSSIINNLRTTGKEWMFVDGTEYIGLYHRYLDGLVMSGGTYNRLTSQDLIPYIDYTDQPNNQIYDALIPKPRYIAPEYQASIPTEKDFKNGQYVRYFLRLRTSTLTTDIIEVTKPQFTLYNKVGQGIEFELYTGVQVPWKLTGPLTDVKLEFGIDSGVSDTNRRTVLRLDQSMPGLKNFLTDYTEYTIYSKLTSSKIKSLFG